MIKLFTIDSNTEGVCPRCGHKFTANDYTDIRKLSFTEKYASISWRCDECGTSGKELFSLEFAGHTFYDDESQEEVRVRMTPTEQKRLDSRADMLLDKD